MDVCNILPLIKALVYILAALSAVEGMAGEQLRWNNFNNRDVS